MKHVSIFDYDTVFPGETIKFNFVVKFTAKEKHLFWRKSILRVGRAVLDAYLHSIFEE